MLSDHQLSVRDILDNSGSVVNHITYDSYGNVVAQSNASQSSRYLYTGREYDQETGLYYYRARYYEPHQGRFISEDPIGFFGRDLNLYRYVGGDPVRFRDPEGLEPNINTLTGTEALGAQSLPSSSHIPILGTQVGNFTVSGHGNEAGDRLVVIEKDPKSGKVTSRKELTGKEVADLIKKHKDYRPGDDVRLYICNSGKKLAQDVATELGSGKVTGPTGVIEIKQNLSTVKLESGRWATFTP
jgi:RHS repeat-associated protein